MGKARSNVNWKSETNQCMGWAGTWGKTHMHPFRDKAKAAAAAKLKSYGGSSKKGYAFGGIVDGATSAPTGSTPSRSGGKGKGQTVVNVVVAPSSPSEQPPMGAMPPPAARPPVPPPQPPPMPPMGGPPPPGGPPMGPPMGGPPGMGMRPPGMRTGGRIGYKSGGKVKDKMCRADGGEVSKKKDKMNLGDGLRATRGMRDSVEGAMRRAPRDPGPLYSGAPDDSMDPVADHLAAKGTGELGASATQAAIAAGILGSPGPKLGGVGKTLGYGNLGLAGMNLRSGIGSRGAAQAFRDTGLPGRPSGNPDKNSGMADGGSIEADAARSRLGYAPQGPMGDMLNAQRDSSFMTTGTAVPGLGRLFSGDNSPPPQGETGMPVKRASGGSVINKLKDKQNKKPKFMAGGKVKLDAGAATGPGRLEISKATKMGAKK